ncbi:hypothetical protein HL666_11645 [Bradyrhizobium sp. 83002]|nr:hypothetical protein [Bradyrhizobium aeschynomenes]
MSHGPMPRPRFRMKSEQAQQLGVITSLLKQFYLILLDGHRRLPYIGKDARPARRTICHDELLRPQLGMTSVYALVRRIASQNI